MAIAANTATSMNTGKRMHAPTGRVTTEFFDDTRL
jgi:hypothetical protein